MSRRSRRTLSALAVLTTLGAAWLGQPTAAHAQLPLGEEFRVNSYTTNTQYRTAVASQPDGRFVVVWNSRDQDGSDLGVFGQRYDADGDPLGGEFQVNTYTTGGQRFSAVAADADGNFVVVWYGVSPTGAIIFGQRYDAVGNSLGGEFQVMPGFGSPAVARDADGDFIVVAGNGAIFGRRFEASGTPIGGHFQVSQAGAFNTHYSPAVGADEDGEFVVTWTAGVYYGPPFQRTIFQEVLARRYDAAGNARGNQFQVNTFEDNFEGHPDIVMDPEGAFLIVWESFGTCPLDEEECAPAGRSPLWFGINAQRYDAEGMPVGGEFEVAPEGGYNREPSVARRTENDFVVVWNDPSYPNPPPQDVYGRVVTESGALVGSEFTVNSYSTGRQDLADVVPLADGDFVVLWQGPGSTDTSGIFGQRITMSALTLRITGGGCPGQATATILNAPPNSEVALIRAANQNGFVKGGALCSGTQLAIGEPFQLPPVFVITDANGEGSTQLELSFNRCYVQALALQSCETSNTSRVR
jgi:hypothetical protein